MDLKVVPTPTERVGIGNNSTFTWHESHAGSDYNVTDPDNDITVWYCIILVVGISQVVYCLLNLILTLESELVNNSLIK